jgi:hypothetical protein
MTGNVADRPAITPARRSELIGRQRTHQVGEAGQAVLEHRDDFFA